MAKVDEETAMRNQSQKLFRELESQLAEITDDLDVEKAARQKAEKNRHDLNEELEALKNELLDSLDTTVVSELTSLLQESERGRSEVQDTLVRVQTDMDSLTAQLVETESRSANATKSNATTEQQLNEMQAQIEVIELEKKLRNFDKILAEEKAISERFASKRDAAERDAREKETKVLSLSRDLEEYIVKVEELERSRRVLQNELDELANSRGTADKNVEETGSGDKTQTIAKNYEDERFDVHIPDSDLIFC
ncbi:hypothetical protein QYM36_006866 [Artemia franciscana]|uniref:Myosin tail domain-containing protein n=1 Tax=Artemia franciscana TaxID=6661 RepID=A0AA88HYL9_ARTSF|nr:hypothetical protein QYM36_006866 [Artemia franciscana]